MDEVSPGQLKRAVELQNGCTATLVEQVPVHEEEDGQTVWDGTVSVFDLVGHPKATRAYAWSSERDGRRRIVVILGGTKVASPIDAVRVASAAEKKLK